MGRHGMFVTLAAIVMALTVLAGPARAQLSCGPFVDGQTEALNGDFILGVSYFSAIAASTPDVEEDLGFFKSRGFNNVRVFANWTAEGASGATVFNSVGGLNNKKTRLKALIDAAADVEMTVDVTFSWRQFGENQCAESCHVLDDNGCWGHFKAGVRNLGDYLRAQLATDNVFFDLANEFNEGGTCKDLGTTEVEELQLELEHNGMLLNQTASTGGNVHTNDSKHKTLLEDGSVDFLSPHFDRNAQWATQAGERIDEIRDTISPFVAPIYSQEPMRRGWQDCGQGSAGPSESVPPCDEDSFLQAASETASYGGAGWVFHTPAGFRFDLDLGSFEDRLDLPPLAGTVEKETLDCDGVDGVIDCIAEQVAFSRCIAPPKVEATFEGDRAGGPGWTDEYVKSHLTERGGLDWENDDAKLRIHGDPLARVLTTGGDPIATSIGGFKYNLPAGYSGLVSLSFGVATGDGSRAKIGFASEEQTPLNVDGEFWFEAFGGLMFVHGPGNSILGALELPYQAGQYMTFEISIDLGTLAWSSKANGSGWGSGTLGSQPDVRWLTVEIDNPVNDVTRFDNIVITRE
jgi:hypothetical protein